MPILHLSESEAIEKEKELLAKLRPLLTEQFLSTLVRAIKTCDDDCGDREAQEGFVDWCFDKTKEWGYKERYFEETNLSPYISYDED